MTDGTDLGGDPVCWLDRVCPECGLFLDDTEVLNDTGVLDGTAAPCPRCGHEWDNSPTT